jgi:cytochrome c2
MKSFVKLALVGVALAAAPAAALAEGDAAKGEKIFNRCKTCHMVGDNAKNRVGPAAEQASSAGKPARLRSTSIRS